MSFVSSILINVNKYLRFTITMNWEEHLIVNRYSTEDIASSTVSWRCLVMQSESAQEVLHLVSPSLPVAEQLLYSHFLNVSLHLPLNLINHFINISSSWSISKPEVQVLILHLEVSQSNNRFPLLSLLLKWRRTEHNLNNKYISYLIHSINMNTFVCLQLISWRWFWWLFKFSKETWFSKLLKQTNAITEIFCLLLSKHFLI